MKKVIIIALFALAFVSTTQAGRKYIRGQEWHVNEGVLQINYDKAINKTCNIHLEAETYFQGVSVELQVEYSGGNYHGGARPYAYGWSQLVPDYEDRTQYIETLDWVRVTGRNPQGIPNLWSLGYYYYQISYSI